MEAIKSWLLEFFGKVALELKSRKFWVLVATIVASAQAKALGEITEWQFVMAVIAALSVYSTGIAIVKAALLLSQQSAPKKD